MGHIKQPLLRSRVAVEGDDLHLLGPEIALQVTRGYQTFTIARENRQHHDTMTMSTLFTFGLVSAVPLLEELCKGGMEFRRVIEVDMMSSLRNSFQIDVCLRPP